MTTQPSSSSAPDDIFVATHWSVVTAAGRQHTSQSGQALATLCQTYWLPLYTYVRRRGCSPHDAEDLTQEFFARILARNDVATVSAERGKFRACLLAAINHFLSDEWDKARAQKRGGGRAIQSLALRDGTNWQSVGGGWPGTVSAMALRGSALYVGGNWTNASGDTIHAVRGWDGANWFYLGSDVGDARNNQQVSALLATPDALWVGGRFAWAGGKPSANVARWIETPQLGMVRRFDKRGKHHKAGKLEFHVDPGMRGHLEVSTNLMNWTTLPDGNDDCSNWQVEASGSAGQWFYRIMIGR